MSRDSDPETITEALTAAIDAFNEEGHGIPTREAEIDPDADWKTQLTKACGLLAAVDSLSGQGFHTATIELCFGATERSVEAYALAEGGDDLDDFHDHTTCYDRATDLGLLSDTTTHKVGYFHEFDSERLSVALKETEDDDVEPGFLRIAYNWARTRAIQGYVDVGTAFDPEAIQNAVSEVSDSIDRFSTVRKKTTSIRKTANEIDEELEEIEGEVKSELADIRAEIQTAE
jgi:hypothetical protein